ncbi:MAG: hypothetical protein FWF90_04180 [Promicromonosporaceae bacterium]|nr:hypothetical protein [Promicromonosporaceae bacterium]
MTAVVGVAPAGAAAALGQDYFLTNGVAGGAADVRFAYGRPDDAVVVGDWDGNGTDTLGVRRGNQLLLSNTTASGSAAVTFAYGNADDAVLVGDWDGDGRDTFAVRRGNQFFLTNSTTSGPAAVTFAYGRPGDTVLVGDWDGDGKDTLAVRRGNQYFLSNTTASGPAAVTFAYGKVGDAVLVGDWNGDGKDSLGVRRGSQYFLTNGTRGGNADVAFAYGRANDVVLVGDWNGDGKDTLGVRRPEPTRLTIKPFTGDLTIPLVGIGVQPGIYKSVDSTRDCDWFTYAPDDSTGTGTGNGAGLGRPSYLQVGPGDRTLWLTQWDHPGACGTWTQAFPDDIPQLDAHPADGDYRVGIDIAPGTYRSLVPGGGDARVACMTQFLTDLTGYHYWSDGSNYLPITIDGYRVATVTISPDLPVFESSGCGTWSRIG